MTDPTRFAHGLSGFLLQVQDPAARESVYLQAMSNGFVKAVTETLTDILTDQTQASFATANVDKTQEAAYALGFKRGIAQALNLLTRSYEIIASDGQPGAQPDPTYTTDPDADTGGE